MLFRSDTFANQGIASYRRSCNDQYPNNFTNLSLIALRSKIVSKHEYVEKTKEWINFSSDLTRLKNNKIIQKNSTSYEFHHKNNVNNNTSEISNSEIKAINYISEHEQKEILKKIRGKKIKIEKKIDLHSKTLDEAYTNLKEFLSNCYYSGLRYLLVIVGKGKENNGIIKSKIQHWVESNNAICDKVMLFTEALPEHGGDGAYYVFFRRS